MHLKSILILILLTSLVVFAKTGYASWYGGKYQGKPTASGEPFDMYAYTAANRTLPFGTVIRVTNLKNNKSVKVRVNDRGPTQKSRIVDLSYQAAKDIGLLQYGIVPVKIETISTPSQTTDLSKSDNPYLKDTKSNQEYMKEYAEKMPKVEKSVDYNEYLPSNVPSSSTTGDYAVNSESKTKQQDIINVQVAAFSNKKNAEIFINRQKDSGYNMKIIEVVNHSKILYKVIILCNSSKVANHIIKSERYVGAYILRK